MAVERAFDPLELPADRFFNWIYHVFTREMDEQRRMRFDIQLYSPLPGDVIGSVDPPERVLQRAAEMFRAAQSEPW